MEGLPIRTDDLSGHISDFERWKLLPLIPLYVRTDVLRNYGDISILVTNSIEYELENWSTHREYASTKVLEQGDNYVVFKRTRCTVSTNEHAETRVSIWVLPAKPILQTNMNYADDPDAAGVYVECYGEFPTAAWLSDEFLNYVRTCPKRIWNVWGEEIPSDTRVSSNFYGWQSAFNAGAARQATTV